MVAMSGCFTQRGEPALLDKWSRARAALACGVDLVFELPFAYASASAERFACGGVRLLQATGLRAELVFGSESGNLTALKAAASILAEEPRDFRLLLREQLSAGLSFPDARQKALARYSGDENLSALLSESNNILAIEYLKALQNINSDNLRPFTIQRSGQPYKENIILDDKTRFASASAIRRTVEKFIGSREPDLYSMIRILCTQMPAPSLAEMLIARQDGPGLIFSESLALMIISRLRSISSEELTLIPGMEEGLGNRLQSAAGRPASSGGRRRLEQLVQDAATRRFPRTRIQRAVIAMLAGLKHSDYAMFDACGGPQYLRILGFNRRGRYLLKIMRKTANRPIITRASDFAEYNSILALNRMADLDIQTSDIWMLAAGHSCGQDFDTPVFMR